MSPVLQGRESARAWATGRAAPGAGIPVALLASALLALAGCAENGADTVERQERDADRRGGTLVVAGPADLGAPNVFGATDNWTQEINRYVLYLPLLRFTPELDYAPALAASWEATDTGAVFRMRRDVRWHDGRPTTAEDVVFTIRRAMQPETAFPNAGYFERWTSVEAADSYTVRVRFSPHAEPLAGLPFTPIMPAHLLDSVPPERLRQASFNQKPVGNGPFRFVSVRHNDRWVFEANEDFPAALGGRPYLDRFVWRVVPENSAQVAELRAGDAHLSLTPPAAQIGTLDSMPGLKALVKPSRKYGFIAWNGLRPPLDRPDVRRALTMAIDREEIIEALRGGYGELAAGPIAPHHWSYDPEIEPLPFDTAAARELLRQAGLRDRNGDGTLETADGETFTIELKLPSANAFNRDVAEMIRSDLQAVGVRVRLRALEWNTLVSDITTPERRFDAALLAWETDFKVNLRDNFHSDAMAGPFQSASYSNPEVDSLIDRAAVTVDRDDARRLHARLQEILRDEQPWSFLFYYPDLFLARERLHTDSLDIRGTFAKVADWWLEGAARTGSDRVAPDSVLPGEPAPDTQNIALEEIP